jgi:hypothetical protein
LPGKSRTADVWKDALRNQICLFWVKDPDQKNVFHAKFDFGQAEVEPSAVPISCELTFRILPNHEDCELISILYEGKRYSESSCSTEEWNWVQEIGLTALGTKITFNCHFCNSHLLTAGGLYCLATVNLPDDHPIRILIHVHGHPVSFVNAIKGIPLLACCFTKSFFCTAKGFKTYVEQVIKEYDIYGMNPKVMAEKAKWPEASEQSPFYREMFQTYRVFHAYVKKWVNAAYPTKSKLESDHLLKNWWDVCKTYDFFKNWGELTRRNLITILTNYVFCSISFHDLVGDRVKTIANRTYTFIPSSPAYRHEQRAESAFFRIIYFEVTKAPSVLLSSSEWIDTLVEPYKNFAKTMQKGIADLGIDDYDLSVNK